MKKKLNSKEKSNYYKSCRTSCELCRGKKMLRKFLFATFSTVTNRNYKNLKYEKFMKTQSVVKHKLNFHKYT